LAARSPRSTPIVAGSASDAKSWRDCNGIYFFACNSIGGASVGRQALEIEFLKGALKNAPRPRSATTSVIAGPTASPSQKDAG
jgi:hypothetical protein